MLAALRAAAREESLQIDRPIDAIDVESVIASGLGPMLFHLLAKDDGHGRDSSLPHRLRAAYLTSVALTDQLMDNVEQTLAVLNAEGIDVTLLKGISHATRYYAAPQLRVMGDVDLLLQDSMIERATKALLGAGFTRPEPPKRDWANHVHSPGLYDPKRKLWIELHRKLVPDGFAPSVEAPLDLRELSKHRSRDRFGEQPVWRLHPEFELVYLAVGWCRDLTDSCADPGLRRMLFDFVTLLNRCESLDWEQVLKWSEGTLTGACLDIIYSYLVTRGVIDDAAGFERRLHSSQPFTNAVSRRLIHRQIDRYIVGIRSFGAVRTAANVSSVLDALIARRPAWRNVLDVPFNIMFPRREPRRHEWRYQLERLRSLLRPR